MKINLLKSKYRYYLIMLFVLAIVSAFIGNAIMTRLSIDKLRDKISDSITDGKAVSVSTPMLNSSALYCLYECGGKIGIYDANSGVLLDFINVFVDTLPAADRIALKKGIDIYSFSDLDSVIADLSS